MKKNIIKTDTSLAKLGRNIDEPPPVIFLIILYSTYFNHLPQMTSVSVKYPCIIWDLYSAGQIEGSDRGTPLLTDLKPGCARIEEIVSISDVVL